MRDLFILGSAHAWPEVLQFIKTCDCVSWPDGAVDALPVDEKATANIDVARMAVDVSGPPAPAGSRLPVEERDDLYPLLEGTVPACTGAFVVLDDGRVLPRTTALMWAHVNPFSPLGNGKRLVM